MNFKDIEKENYVKTIIQLRRESKKYEGLQVQKSEVKESSSLSLYNQKNQQQLEDQQSIHNFRQPNSKFQQQGSNITSISNISSVNFSEKLDQAQNLLKEIISYLYQINQNDLDETLEQFEKMITQQIKKEQSEICQDLSFNKDDTLLATAIGQNIKIQKFYNENLSQIAILKGHIQNIGCVMFSKKTNTIFSGGYIDDHLICMWEETIQNNWEQSVSKDSKSPITCMVLNQKESLLIVGNKYGFVQTWYIDYKKKQIIVIDEKRKIHQKVVYGLSLNPSETQLVTCSGDSKIIIWKLDRKGILELMKEIIKNTFFTRIQFLDNYRFLVSQNKRGLIEFRISNLEIIENTIYQTDNEDFHYFPIQCNQDSQLIIVKHYRSVYIIRDFNKGDYDIQKQLDFQSDKIVGTLSSNGKYLAIQDEKIFYIYKLLY